MSPELQQFIEKSDYTQDTLRALATRLPVDDAALDALIGESVAASDEQDFIFLTMAALSVQRVVPARHLARGTMLMPEKHHLGLIALHMTGDIAGPLVEAVESLSLATTELVSTALFLAADWQHRQAGGKLSAKLISLARTATRNKANTIYDWALLQRVATLSGDEGLKTLAFAPLKAGPGEPRLQEAAKAAEAVTEQMFRVWRGNPLDHVPAKPPQVVGEGYTVRRAVARTGRNEPCPCGSGKKYKHCCAAKDAERLQHSTNIAGVTLAELRANPERYLTQLDLEHGTPQDAARFDPLKIAPELREHYLASLCRGKLFDACVAALEKFGYDAKLKEAFENILIRLAQARRKDLVNRLLKVWPEASQANLGAVDLFLKDEDPAQMMRMLKEECLTLLSNNDVQAFPGFSRTLLQSNLCALGIFVARGMIATLPLKQATPLVDELLLARDKLNLAPEDPISDVLDKRSVEQHDEGKDAEALREAQDKLQAKLQEVQRYRDSIKRLEQELHRREQPPTETKLAPATAPATPVDEVALSQLRQKVKELKSALTERHSERNELRRELQKAQTDLETLRETAAPAATRDQVENDHREDDLFLPEEATGQQPVRAIECPPHFPETLRRVPPAVARGTMTAVGRLAAGDPTAFVNTLRLKACPDILRRRVGIDFRLLFRLLPDRVQVVDLIPRQDLERKIKTLV